MEHSNYKLIVSLINDNELQGKEPSLKKGRQLHTYRVMYVYRCLIVLKTSDIHNAQIV